MIVVLCNVGDQRLCYSHILFLVMFVKMFSFLIDLIVPDIAEVMATTAQIPYLTIIRYCA